MLAPKLEAKSMKDSSGNMAKSSRASLNPETIEMLIRERRTVHEYVSEPVERSIWMKALELASWAPNHKLTQPWRFIVIQNQARDEVIRLAIEVRNEKSKMSASETEALRSRYLAVPVLVAVAMKKSGAEEQQREDYAAVAGGLQNASLYLVAHSLGSKWSTGKLIRHPQMASALGLENDEELLGFYWIGRAAKTPSVPPRRSISDFVRESK